MIGKGFNSPDVLVKSFTLERQSLVASAIHREGLTTTLSGVPIDLLKVDYIYNRIYSCEHTGVRNAIKWALETLSTTLRYRPPAASLADPAGLLIPCVVILETPDLNHTNFIETLRNVIFVFYNSTTEIKQRLLEYICNISEDRFCRHVAALQNFITDRVDKGAVDEFKQAVAVLSLWVVAAKQFFPASPRILFCNAAVNESYASSRNGKRQEYSLWLKDLGTKDGKKPSAIQAITVQHSSSGKAVSITVPIILERKYESLVSYPFVLSPGIKAAVLELDAARQMKEGAENEMQQAVATGSRFVLPYLGTYHLL